MLTNSFRLIKYRFCNHVVGLCCLSGNNYSLDFRVVSYNSVLPLAFTTVYLFSLKALNMILLCNTVEGLAIFLCKNSDTWSCVGDKKKS